MERSVTVLVAGIALFAAASTAGAQSLRGSAQAMQRQNRIAQQHDYTFLRTSSQVRKFVDNEYLVPIRGNPNYELAAVSYPYGRPALKVFVERLASQYRSACGEKLVVTSLTRPLQEQPRNASDLSVHPAGMAVDLRVSRRSSCRKWLERTLLSLEKQGVLDVTRENRPPHYHVALFPESYASYVARITDIPPSRILAAATSQAPATRASADNTAVAERNGDGPGAAVVAAASAGTSSSGARTVSSTSDVDVQSYRVNRGDSLWSIARRLGTTVDTLKSLNGLRGSALVAGQVIQVPVSVGAESN